MPRPALEDLKSASLIREDIVAPLRLSHARKVSDFVENSSVSMTSVIVVEVRVYMQSVYA